MMTHGHAAGGPRVIRGVVVLITAALVGLAAYDKYTATGAGGPTLTLSYA